MLRSLMLASVVVGSLILPTVAAAQAFTDEQEAAIRDVVREYLVENPDVIVDALNELERREQVAQAEAQAEAIRAAGATLYDNDALPFAGAVDGEVVLVEFMDYQCGYCKRMLDPIHSLIGANEDLRVVFVDIPILGPPSVTAARAALAARNQDAYLEMHDALMGFDGGLSDAAIFTLASDLGLDVDRLRADMDSDEVTDRIQGNMELANLLGVRGTPAFVINDTLIPGAVGEARLQAEIDDRG